MSQAARAGSLFKLLTFGVHLVRDLVCFMAEAPASAAALLRWRRGAHRTS